MFRVPTQRCHRFATEEACINAMDPYCGWNEQRAKCTTAPSRTTKVTFWKQNFSSCPILSTNVRIFLIDLGIRLLIKIISYSFFLEVNGILFLVVFCPLIHGLKDCFTKLAFLKSYVTVKGFGFVKIYVPTAQTNVSKELMNESMTKLLFTLNWDQGCSIFLLFKFICYN